jgi:hypothetical protein
MLVAFLGTLTDPCVQARACLSEWIPNNEAAADELQLNAIGINGYGDNLT